MVFVTTDAIITIAYFSIPIQLMMSLYKFPRLTRAPIHLVILFVLFALFILCCGCGHLLRCMDWSNGTLFTVVNFITAIVSMSTSLYLLPLIPTLCSEIDHTLVKFRRSESIVHDMYPPSIREKLFESLESSEHSDSDLDDSLVDVFHNSDEFQVQHGTDHCATANTAKKVRRVSFKLREFLQYSAHGGTVRSSRTSPFVGEPIAQEFHSVGIMFADIVEKKIEHLIYGDHNYGARRAPRPPEGNHWHPEG